MKALIVREHFSVGESAYAKGQAITDPQEIAAVEADRLRGQHFHAVDLPESFFRPDEPQPEPVAAKPVAAPPPPAAQAASAPAPAPVATPAPAAPTPPAAPAAPGS